MKNLMKYIFPAIVFLLAFSCGKNETVKTDNKCGHTTAKLVWNFCSGAAIEILSDKSIGEEWTRGGKTYHHAVVAALDSTLSKANEDWSRVIGSSDSVFYFNYVLEQFLICKVCCPPTQTIIITSFASRPCASGN
ncbi:MAG: hypothetical protein HY015_07595 [Bacteroidetes bacterium]|nr:hypothetical protein [Bacteroidota bacterium]MBI3482822.1 hypothetical protein [Bacteroidota bacterium]